MAGYGWSEDYVRKGITGAKAWVYDDWLREEAIVRDGMVLKRETPGFIRQEIERLRLEKHG